MLDKVLGSALAAGFAVNALGTQAGLVLGPFSQSNRRYLDALSLVFIARYWLRKRNPVRALWLLVLISRVKLFKHSNEKLSLFQWLLRKVLFRTANLPHVVPVDLMMKQNRKYGHFRRHEYNFEDELSTKAWTIIRPFSEDTRLAVPFIFVSDPKHIESILADRDAFPSRGHTGFTTHVGKGLLGLPTGEMHTKHRRVVGKYLSNTHLREYAKTTQAQVSVFLEKWRKAASQKRQVNAYYDLSMLTLDVIMEIGTGERTVDTSSQLIKEQDNVMAHDMDWALRRLVAGTAFPMLEWIPNKRVQDVQGRMDDLFRKLVKRAKDIPDDMRPAGSILHGLLSAKNEDGSPALTDEEILEEFKTIRGAGHETTGNTICFMIKLLAENPRVLAKLREEVDASFDGDCPDFDQARKMQYAMQVMYETLRIYPTVPNFPREAAYDVKLGDFDVPKGSMVFVSQVALNMDPDVWSEPEEFRPERFDNVEQLQPTKPVGVPGKPQHQYSFVPFGASNRTCIGQRLAMLEGVQIIASIVKHFDFQVAVDPLTFPERVCSDITMGPKKGLPLDVKVR